MDRVYLNGRFVSREHACVPVTDRGLLFGDSVYEVIPAYGGVPFRLAQHLQRLERSLAAIRLDNPLSRSAWEAVIGELCGDGGGEDRSIYVQVTRGAYPTRNHRIPAEVTPTVIAFSSPIPQRDPRIAQKGIAVITTPDIRWHRCDIKATTLLANILAQAEAVEKGADDAIFVRDGLATEGTASNLFIVAENRLITPPKGDQLLPGITRDLVLELAKEAGVPYRETPITVDSLAQATEVWLTSSTREIAPVVRLDGRTVGDGRPGPLWRRMDRLFQQAKERLRQAARKRDETNE
ncbi:MAG: D-amino acid aminotransferase [Gammaproteobacteria bacterium]|nr:MAG: D-amino acid aminotransferase [Gammaproteobacteria bacterium]